MDLLNNAKDLEVRRPQVLQIIQYPNPMLETPSSPVIPGVSLTETALKGLLGDMVATLQAHRALGLAAIQVGVPLQILVIQDEIRKPISMINPMIIESSGSAFLLEGCLSILGMFEKIRRDEFVKVQYFDENLAFQTLETGGLLARAFLHEFDHLQGKTFLDQMSNLKRSDVLRKMKLRARKMRAVTRELTRSGEREPTTL